jgi:Tfp pilus assembly protein PilV
MHTFFGMLPADRPPRRRRSATAQAPERANPRTPPPSYPRVRAGADDGFLLVEVIVSALLVALIVVGTLNGFDAASRTGLDSRNHNEATVLANESQEALRSDPASIFNSAGKVFEHSYTKTVNGTTFTVTQTGTLLNSAGEGTACAATNSNRQETNSVKITSSVTWAALTARTKRPPVTESSTTTPPAGSTLEVDVGNYPTPTAGVAGVTAIVKYTPESDPTSTLEGTTEGPGCFVFTSLPVTSATVEIREKSGFVTPSGGWKVEPKEVAIAPNYTTHYAVTLNEGGAIKTQYSWKGSSEYTHAGNGGVGTVKEPASATTFVAYNEEMGATPEFELGDSGKGSLSAGKYSVEPNTYATEETTPKEAVKYPNGNLFPFPETEPWKVYAGACPENDPHKLNGTITDPHGVVLPGKTTTVTGMPLAYMKLNVYTGKKSSSPKVLQEATAYPVTITNTACKSVTPNNQGEVNEPKSEQKQTTSVSLPGWGGHLEHPFLPLGAGRLCLAYNTAGGGAKHYTFTSTIEPKAEEEYTRNIYLEETSPAGGEYTENVKRLPSGTEESATVKVVKAGFGSEAKCS